MEETKGNVIEQNESVEGVKGWLLFFCISLTILSPIFIIREILTYWRELSPVFYIMGQIKLFVIIETIVNMGIIIFGVYAGLSLWSKNKNAVATAHNFLVFTLIGRVFINVYVFVLVITTVGIDSQTGPELIFELILSIFGACVYFFVWRAYLNNSVRVLNTYNLESLPPEPEAG